MFYLLLSIVFCIIVIRVRWVYWIHSLNENLKSEYMHISGDNTIRRRSKRSRFWDYFRIWVWLRVDFLKHDYKIKLDIWKNQ